MENSHILIFGEEHMPVPLIYFGHYTLHIFTVDLD